MTLQSQDIESIVEVLHQGGVIAYPTEAVFGLGCDPQQDAAIEKLLALKQRPADKGLILIAAEERQLYPYLDLQQISEATWQRVRASWPGHVTWLLPVASTVSTLLRGVHSTLAVRVTTHAQVQTLCTAFGGPLVSTSANLAGQSPARTVQEVIQQFDDQLDAVLAGDTGGADKPSEIRDALTGRILRPGSQEGN